MWDVKLYPNPANNFVTLLSNGAKDEVLHLAISDINGKVIIKKEIRSDSPYRMELDLLNGVYIATISNSKNETVVKKLVISK
ncbi:MAG: T9SS type A sorting domain-containing protein [Bacteroidia bacterium]